MVLRILFSIVLVMLASNLVAAAFIIVRYLIKLEIRSMSVILFYIFAILVTIGYMITICISLENPSYFFYNFH